MRHHTAHLSPRRALPAGRRTARGPVVSLVTAAVFVGGLIAGCDRQPSSTSAPPTGPGPAATGQADPHSDRVTTPPATPPATQGGARTPRGTGQSGERHRTVEPPPPAKAPVKGSRLPAQLVGRWQGGAGDAFWYTFTAAGAFAMENRRTGVSASGVVRLSGSRLTLLKTNGETFIAARTWRVQSMTVYDEPIHVLHLDDETYAKDEYYQP